MTAATPAASRPSRHAAQVDAWLARHRPGFVADLMHLVSIDTRSPRESDAYDWLAGYFTALGAEVTAEPRHPALAGHGAANRNEHSTLSASERANLHVRFPADAGLSRVLFSAHVDVVPPAADFPDGFRPRVSGDAVVGRGTADTKGNIVMLAAALRCAAELGLPLSRAVELDLVVEEEIGGNGALSTILHGRDVSEVVVLEPTDLEVLHGHRGCLEFTVRIGGRASHMGGDGVSAIDGAMEYIAALRGLEARLMAEAMADPDFAGYARPMQINVGRIAGGEWHGSIPALCSVGGAFGFHPRYSLDDVRGMLTDLVAGLGDPWLREHTDIRYEGIRNGAYVGDPHSAVATDLRREAQAATGRQRVPRAWSVSCDARLYHDHLAVPTVVFGAGQLAHAHSSAEQLSIAEWSQGVATLVGFLTADREVAR
ncbi:M20/M25/M40 family metallo-hydrolase [Micromonospora sp. NBC_01405]|uniref:M20 family metallopeptidase n=1 Tax=Micromonospora sp. NBC_01405 TaxID=2903589 RepID=UPI00324B8BF7